MEASKSKRQNNEADLQSHKVELKKQIEILRAEIREMHEGRHSSGISAPESVGSQILRTPGRFRGKLIIPDDFNDPMTLDEVMNVSGE